MRTFVFRIRRRYITQIMNIPSQPNYDPAEPTKDIEFRRNSPFWYKKVFGHNNKLCEKYPNAFDCEEFTRLCNEVAEGPEPSQVPKQHDPVVFTVSAEDTEKHWGGAKAVFVCGKTVFRRRITQIDYMTTPSTFSEQGKKDVDTPMCFGFHLGGAIT